MIFEGLPSGGHHPRGPTKVAEERPQAPGTDQRPHRLFIGSPLATILVNSILGNGGFPIQDMKVLSGQMVGLEVGNGALLSNLVEYPSLEHLALTASMILCDSDSVRSLRVKCTEKPSCSHRTILNSPSLFFELLRGGARGEADRLQDFVSRDHRPRSLHGRLEERREAEEVEEAEHGGVDRARGAERGAGRCSGRRSGSPWKRRCLGEASAALHGVRDLEIRSEGRSRRWPI